MYPVISIVGWHNAGKTTFAELLLAELAKRGLRVAAIKHSQGHFDLDHPGTDTQRYTEANADIVGIVGHGRIALVEHRGVGADLQDHLSRLPDDLDLVIVEGYKRDALPKFEILGRDKEHTPIAPRELLLSEVSWSGHGMSPAAKARSADASGDALHIQDVASAIALLIAHGFIRENSPR